MMQLQLNLTNITNDTVFSGGPPVSDILDLIYYNIPYVRIVTCIMAILTNILVLITVAKSRKSWKYSTHILIRMLAFVDIAYNSLILGLQVSSLIPHNIIFIAINSVWINMVAASLLGISNCMMILISLNRYALVCKPFSHHKITSRRSTLKQIIAVSTILTLLGFLQLVSIRDIHGICTMGIADVVVYVFISHIVPHTVSVVLTILVMCEFRKNRSTFNESMNTQTESQGEKNITKAMIAVNVAFVLLTLPHTISYSIFVYGACMFELHVAFFFKSAAAYDILNTWRNINFSINIFIYTAYIPKFRVALVNVFKCKWRHQKNGRRDPPEDNQSQNIRRNPNYQITSL